jgi:monofunctional biosynthetic peptidoglycan transglycosylase
VSDKPDRPAPAAPASAPAKRPARPAARGPAKRAGRARRPGTWRRRLAKAIIILALAPVLWVALHRFVPVPFTVLMAQRALAGDTIVRNPVSIADISPHLVRAVIAGEDAKFCQHDGFDWKAIQTAMKNNERGRRLRGGSTISQQTAKNVFLWPGRSWLRKGIEAGFTVLIETLWPKRRIMEAYLNVAEWGDGVFGAEAAALTHFNKHARDLTPLEAARLAAILPSPRKWDPVRPNRRVARKARGIQKGAQIVRDAGLDACVRRPS